MTIAIKPIIPIYLELLQTYGAENGTFLIRNHQKKKRFFVLSLIWNNKGHHFEIEKQVKLNVIIKSRSRFNYPPPRNLI